MVFLIILIDVLHWHVKFLLVGKRLHIQCRRWAHGMFTCLHPWSLVASAVGRFLMPSWEFLHCRGQAGWCGSRLQLCSIRSLAFILSASHHLLTRLFISNPEIYIDDEVMMLSYVYILTAKLLFTSQLFIWEVSIWLSSSPQHLYSAS